MKQTKRFIAIIACALFAMSTWAQMVITFSGLEATQSAMADGSTLVQLPAGTDLNTIGSKMSVTIGETKITDLSIITPNPTETFITEGEIETFVYDGKAYSFRFLAGEYFTVVMFGDPHVAQGSGISVADMQNMATNICNLGKEGGKMVTFTEAPKGYVPTADLVICLGDMDKDNEETGNDFNSAMKGFNEAQIPFITIAGNHDFVPDIYWDNNSDYGLTSSGCSNNEKTLEIIKSQYKKAAGFGGFTVETITDPTYDNNSDVTQAGHFTFKYKGVRFYFANNYWFQKPYKKYTKWPGHSETTYAADGTINALNSYVEEHADDASVWVSHFPFYSQANDWNDASARWWLDQNNAGTDRDPVCLWPVDSEKSEFYNGGVAVTYTSDEGRALAEKKKKALADIIVKSKNPRHFSGHSHKDDGADVEATNGAKFRDHSIQNTVVQRRAFVVLCKEGEGVIEVQRVNF